MTDQRCPRCGAGLVGETCLRVAETLRLVLAGEGGEYLVRCRIPTERA